LDDDLLATETDAAQEENDPSDPDDEQLLEFIQVDISKKPNGADFPLWMDRKKGGSAQNKRPSVLRNQYRQVGPTMR